jgi:hypothetical protein
MTVYRDLGALRRDELVAYFNAGGDISELLRDATDGPDLGSAPPLESIPTIVADVRLPADLAPQLDHLVGDDRVEGPARSNIIDEL